MTLYKIGSLKDSDAVLYTRKQIKETVTNINVLGVEVVTKESELCDLNYKKILDKIKNLLKPWKKRGLCLISKIVIVNTFVISQLIYKMTVLPKMPIRLVKCFNNVIEDFLWNGRRPKILLQVLQNDKKEGGLGLTNIVIREEALKASWVSFLHKDSFLCEIAFQALSPVLRENIWRCNLKKDDVKLLFKTSFWTDVLEAWTILNFEHTVEKRDDILNQIIWNNSLLRIEKNHSVGLNVLSKA